MEIDKYIKVSISDFIPTNIQDYSIEFDELGILKQVNQFLKFQKCILGLITLLLSREKSGNRP